MDARLIGGILRGETVGDVSSRVYDYLANSSLPTSSYSGKSIHFLSCLVGKVSDIFRVGGIVSGGPQ